MNPKRVYNFAAGPAAIPESVLEKAANELVCYGNTGMSVMEMSHRSKMYLKIYEHAEAGLREVMNIPDNYKVLFLQGGATLQFSAVPLNLMAPGGAGSADYVVSGDFAQRAAKEAKRYGNVNVVASSEADNFTRVPDLDPAKFNPQADYFHITTNNTIYGTRYIELPKTGQVPLVADMSSNILSQVYDVRDFGLIYAGAQKNIGPAGVTVVIVREDLTGHPQPICPGLLDYKAQAAADSMVNTPTTYGIYMAGLVFDWLKEQGGVAAIQKVNEKKAKLLYDAIDASKLFKGTAQKAYRSLMNVTFVTGDAETDDKFVKLCEDNGLANVKGYRTVGGMRASIYNAMPIEGVEKLVAMMEKFEKENG